MKIIIAPDSFKGCLSADRVAAAIAAGVRSVVPDAEIVEMPLADGGEGTTDVLSRALHGRRVAFDGVDPLGRPLTASYLVVTDASGEPTAVMDMAAVCGLTLLAPHERRPMRLSSESVGAMLLHAIRSEGCRSVVLGIGGSATCDGGMGVARALGVRFYDEGGHELLPSGEALAQVSRVDCSQISISANEIHLTVICDVDAPLYGERGAACVFAPQKGATPEEVARLDAGLRRYAECVREATSFDISTLPGGGAAGGVGASLAAFLGAELKSGVATVLELIGFEQELVDASLVVTGEGRIDSQTLMGKVPMGVLSAARKKGVPVVALAGSVTDGEALREAGFAGVFSIQPGAISLEEAMSPDVAARNLRETIAQLLNFKLLH